MGRGVQSSERRYTRAVRSAHEAALAPEQWPEALLAIADYAGASGAIFVCHDFAQSNSWIINGGLRDDLSRLYVARYADNVISREVMRRGPGLHAAHRLTDLSALMRSGFGADIWAPQRIRTMLQQAHPGITAGRSSGGFAVALTDRHMDDLTRAERRWRRIAPQLRLAADLYLARSERQYIAEARAGLLDLLADAAFLLTPEGRLIAANQSGEALLANGEGLCADAAQRLRATDEHDAPRLRAAIAAAGGSAPHASGFRLFHPEGWLAIVAPAPEPASPSQLIRPSQVLVRIIEPQASHRRRAETAARLFGLSRRETAILAEIVRGRSVPDVARSLRLSPETVRTHLKRIYDKSDIRSQSELAQLVARLPADTGHAGRVLGTGATPAREALRAPFSPRPS